MISLMISIYIVTVIMAYALCRVASIDERYSDNE